MRIPDFPTLARAVTLVGTALLPALLAGRCTTPSPAFPEPDATAMTKSSRAAPFLWFRRDAEAALRLWSSVFPDARVSDEVRWGPGGPEPAGTLMTATIQLGGQRFMVLNGGPAPAFNDSFSIFVHADTQPEIDELWAKLTAGGGEPGPCGWLKDPFGLSWQIVPSRLLEMLSDGDPERVQRVGAAMLQMGKLDLARLEAAYAGG